MNGRLWLIVGAVMVMFALIGCAPATESDNIGGQAPVATETPTVVSHETPDDDPPLVDEVDPLVGGRWMLVSYPLDGNDVRPLPGTGVTLDFDEGQLGGSTGCNSYGGGYTVQNGQLSIGMMMQTEQYCDGLMDQERAYLGALGQAQSFELSAEQLLIQTAVGPIMYAPAEDAMLEGQEWTLSGIVEGDAVVSTWVDASISARFEEGQVSGSAGCNNYSGGYTVEGQTVRFGPLMATAMACEQERMDREKRFLAALEQVAGYQIDRQSLTLTGEAGQMLLQFRLSRVSAEMNEESLANASYQSEWVETGSVTLVDGAFRQPMVEDSATELVVMLTEHIAFGDVTGNGLNDAAVVLVSQTGGSGSFYDLAVMVQYDGTPVNVATQLLGDRVQIQSLAIENGEIMVDMVQSGPEDPMCCPSQHVLTRYALQGQTLVQLSSEDIVDNDAATGEAQDSVEAFAAAFGQALAAGDMDVVATMVSDPVGFGPYRSEWSSLTPEQLAGELERLMPASGTITLSPADTDLSLMLDGMAPERMLGPDKTVAAVRHTSGWGADGAGELMYWVVEQEDGSLTVEAMMISPIGFGG